MSAMAWNAGPIWLNELHMTFGQDHGQYLTEGLKSLVAITEMPKGAHSNRFEQINIQINTQI